MRFEFATATRIIFGPGNLAQIGPIAASFGKRALVVVGSSVERARPLLEQLVAYFEANAKALRERQPQGETLRRYDEVAQILTGKARATVADGVMWLSELGDALRIPSLSTYGVTNADVPALVEKADVASSMQVNPIKLTDEEMAEILLRAL